MVSSGGVCCMWFGKGRGELWKGGFRRFVMWMGWEQSIVKAWLKLGLRFVEFMFSFEYVFCGML